MKTEITLTLSQVNYILMAPVTGSQGSAERIRLKDAVIEAHNAAKHASDDLYLEFGKSELKAWALGCIAGWSQEFLPTRSGPVPMTDGDRNLLRLSAQALKVWEHVKKNLPVLEEDQEFEVDMDDEIALDSEPA